MPTRKKPSAPPAVSVPDEVTSRRLADLLGLTVARVCQMDHDGIVVKTGRNRFDLWRSVKGYIAFLQRSKTEGASNMERSGTTGDPQELDELIRQVKSARTYNDARTLKVQIDALRSGYALHVDQREHISVRQIADMLAGIGAAMRGAIMRLQSDLPPACEGLDPGKMQLVIRDKADEILRALSDRQSDLWREIGAENQNQTRSRNFRLPTHRRRMQNV